MSEEVKIGKKGVLSDLDQAALQLENILRFEEVLERKGSEVTPK